MTVLREAESNGPERAERVEGRLVTAGDRVRVTKAGVTQW